MSFNSLTFLTAVVLFNQLDYLNHFIKDSDWLIVVWFTRVKSTLTMVYGTTLLFTLKIKFVLKIGELNEFFIIKQIETSSVSLRFLSTLVAS